MRILVTGAAGLLGSHVVDRLLAEGHDVVAVDDLATGQLERLADARAANAAQPGSFSFQRLDLVDDVADTLLRRAHVGAVVHLAMPGPSADVAGLARAVVVSGAALLSAARWHGVDRVVLGLPPAVYGVPSRTVVGERAALAPVEAYGASYAALEQYAGAFHAGGGPAVASLVLAEVYGPRAERRDGVVAELVHAAVEERPARVAYAGGTAYDAVYVDDAVDAVVRALAKGAGRRLHVGTGRPVPVARWAELVAAAAGIPWLEVEPAPAAGGVPAPPLDPAASRGALGWEPFTAVGDALAASVADVRSRR